MKQLIFFFATIITFAFTSCEKDNPQPQQTPTEPQPTVTSYTDFVVITAQTMDSVVFTNNTQNTTEHITAIVTPITCDSDSEDLFKFPLSYPVSTGDQITVKVYHNELDGIPMFISKFLANANTDLCAEFNGQTSQTSGGVSTTFTFVAE